MTRRCEGLQHKVAEMEEQVKDRKALSDEVKTLTAEVLPMDPCLWPLLMPMRAHTRTRTRTRTCTRTCTCTRTRARGHSGRTVSFRESLSHMHPPIHMCGAWKSACVRVYARSPRRLHLHSRSAFDALRTLPGARRVHKVCAAAKDCKA